MRWHERGRNVQRHRPRALNERDEIIDDALRQGRALRVTAHHCSFRARVRDSGACRAACGIASCSRTHARGRRCGAVPACLIGAVHEVVQRSCRAGQSIRVLNGHGSARPAGVAKPRYLRPSAAEYPRSTLEYLSTPLLPLEYPVQPEVPAAQCRCAPLHGRNECRRTATAPHCKCHRSAALQRRRRAAAHMRCSMR